MGERGYVLRRTTMAALVLAGIILLGVVDEVTGYRFGFFVFYFIPISIAAWRFGLRGGCAASVTSAVVWFVADWLSGNPRSAGFYGLWNALIRLVSFLAISYSVARIKLLLTRERKLTTDLREALSQVRTLTGLLPICAKCKKIRTDEGYWHQIEEYITTRTDARFSHGLCEQCATELLREAGLELPEAYQKGASNRREHRPT